MQVFDPGAPLSPAILDGVSAVLTDFLDAQQPVTETIGTPALLELARTFTGGGKRLRPAFCWWGHVAAAGIPVDPEPLLRAAASLDLLHVSALVHDDIIDASDTRRGAPAAHRQFEQLHREADGEGDAAAFGTSAAILLGDLLLMWSVELFETSGLPAEALQRARPLLHAMRTEVTCGQYLDLRAASAVGRPEHLAGELTMAGKILEYKSARYSVARPAQVGAALGGADEELLRALADFGSSAGRAFQLRDDVLGVFGDPAVTGKPAGDDLVEGKRTLLVLSALTAADDATAAELEGMLASGELTDQQLARAHDIIEETGARRSVEDQISQLTDHALGVLERADMTAEGRTALQELTQLSTRRDR